MPSNSDKKIYINVYLTTSLVEKIDKLAEKQERSRNYIIRKILEDYFKK